MNCGVKRLPLLDISASISLFVVLVLFMSGQMMAGQVRPEEERRFDEFIASYLAFKAEDGIQKDWGKVEYNRYSKRLHEWRKELEFFHPKGMSADARVDHRLLMSQLNGDILRIDKERRREWDPELYIPDLTLFYTLEDMEEPKRAERLLHFFSGIPAICRFAEGNLDRVSRFFHRRALEQLDDVLLFLRADALEIMKPFKGRPELRAAHQKALEALVELSRYLRGIPESRLVERMGVGVGLYNAYLSDVLLLDLDAGSLLAKGERFFADTLALLNETAQEIQPGKSWQELIRENRRHHPPAVELLPAWKKEIARARQHVLDHQLVRIPDEETVLVLETPLSQRANSPFGVMDTPSPFSSERVGRLIINPVEEELAPDLKEKLLSGHDFTFIRTIAPHETYPGHHLHALKIQENPRPLRKHINSMLFTEGWGLYCEELMFETGFFPDNGQTRLTQLLSRLWRAARVILDVKLQTNRISYNEARQFLEEQVMFEPQRSAGEVNMYLADPTYFITYIIGYYEIIELRADFRQKMGERFSLLDFHEALLATGAIPVRLARDLLLGLTDGNP